MLQHVINTQQKCSAMNAPETPTDHDNATEPVCPDKTEVACDHCTLFGFLRLFKTMPPEQINRFLSRRQQVGKGEMLFRHGQTFNGVYAVKSGSFKSIALLEHQGEQILGFHLPGELMGLDALQSPHYTCGVVALEAGSVCQLPFTHLDELNTDETPRFQEQVIRILLDQVKHDQRQTLLVGRRTAEERLGAFFLNLAERYARHGFPDNEFRLTMLQNDIANYLGLSMETVSRTLRSFREQELLNIKGKRVRILNPGCLQSLTQYCARKENR